MDQTLLLIFQLTVLIISVVVHEVSHGLMANRLGDPTAKQMGRLTFNPLNHLDFMGSFLVPLITSLGGGFIFGWAKPVPYNPYNLRNQKWGPAIVGAAGPLSNILVALFFGAVIRIGITQAPSAQLLTFLGVAQHIVFLNLVLAIFNLVPIPPLDGSKVLLSALPARMWHLGQALETYGMLLLLAFIFFASGIVGTISLALFKLITGLYI